MRVLWSAVSFGTSMEVKYYYGIKIGRVFIGIYIGGERMNIEIDGHVEAIKAIHAGYVAMHIRCGTESTPDPIVVFVPTEEAREYFPRDAVRLKIIKL